MNTKRVGAEFLTIVIGVLTALGVEAWYSGIKDRAVADGYQERLGEELRSNRETLEALRREYVRAGDYSNVAAGFFDTGVEPADGTEFVVALYNVGRDNLQRLDRSTFEDAVATGRLDLLTPADFRVAIQRAYRFLEQVEAERAPSRDEYLRGVRAWLPLSVIDQIREACPNMSAVEFHCPRVDLSEADVARILKRIDSEQAHVAFQLRRQALPATLGTVGGAIRAVDEALVFMPSG